ncbi:UNVERIFIED_CONTAM: hypothetical protein Scaly_2219800 [Sesamum calycinum]|uniref:Transposase-associated domain-containing protein n=1 Tax=Sesamum calycinum TaxID=2727403 RepID=A0AAW2M8Q5_9LAMI
MFNKNLSGRAGLTPEFEDGVKTSIEWTKGQRRHMDGDKIRCPCRKCKNKNFGTLDEVSYHLCMQGFMPEYCNWTSHGEDIVQDYFEAPSVSHVWRSQPQLTMLMIIIHSGVMNNIWIGRKGWFLIQPGRVILLLLTSVPNDGTRSCFVDAGPSSYCYGGNGPYDYDESGLADCFFNIVHAADQPLWNGCNQSQLGAIAELVDIKADGHIYEQIYDKISQWANRILPSDHTLPGDYYNMKSW